MSPSPDESTSVYWQPAVQPPPPAPGRRTGLIVAATGGGLIVVILVVAMVLAIIYGRSDHATAAAGPTGTAKVGAGAGGHPGDLRDYLLKAPPGASSLDLTVGHDGVLSAADAAQDSLNEQGDEDSLLTGNGFVDGAVVGWTTSDDLDVVINLLRFDSQAHAANYFGAETTDVLSGFEVIDRHYITAIPEAISVTTEKPDSDGYYYSACYAASGDTIAFILVDQRTAAPSTDVSDDIVTQQFGKL